MKKKKYFNFRKLILTRCQVEFEKQSVDESERNTKVKEIEECTDPVGGNVGFIFVFVDFFSFLVN